MPLYVVHARSKVTCFILHVLVKPATMSFTKVYVRIYPAGSTTPTEVTGSVATGTPLQAFVQSNQDELVHYITAATLPLTAIDITRIKVTSGNGTNLLSTYLLNGDSETLNIVYPSSPYKPLFVGGYTSKEGRSKK